MFKNPLLDTIFIIVRRIVYGILFCTHFLPTRKNKIVILCYHSIGNDSWRYTVTLENLKKQINYMLTKYKPITLETVEAYIKGEIEITEPSFAVTFDDGYEDILQTVPYFKSVNISPTVFVLGDTSQANKAVMESDRPFLSVNQIKELKNSGWGIGSHTMTHSDLHVLHGEDVVTEVVTSKTMLEKQLGFSIPYIAYPLGNYTQEVMTAFSTAGYRMGLSMDDSFISGETDIRIVPRVGVDGSHTYTEFIATISDAIIYLRSLVKEAMRKKDSAVVKKEGLSIDVVVKYFWPVAAGTETNILETYSALVSQGWNVTVHTSLDTLTERNVLAISEDYRGIWIRRYVFGLFGFWPRIHWNSTNIVALHNFNIIPFYFILFYSLFLKIIGRKKFTLILVPHGGFVLYTRHLSLLKRLIITFLYNTLGVFLINSVVDGIRTVSRWEQDVLCSRGIKSNLIRTITNGTESEAYVDVEKEASEAIKERVTLYGRYIVQMGRIEPVKNYETTIRALKFLPDNVNYIIVGPIHSQEYKDYLNDLIAREGLINRVVFAGVVRGVDKYYLLKHAQLMVHMSMWESYCNAVHEGMSQGLICIVSNVTGLPELIQDGNNGYCIDPFDYENLALRINQILECKGSNELAIITERNSKGVRLRSWDDVARDYAQMVVALV